MFVSSMKSELMALGGVMTITLVGKLDDDSHLQWCVYGLRVLDRVVVCALATVSEDVCTGSDSFSLIN